MRVADSQRRSYYGRNTIVIALSQWRKAPELRQSADRPAEQHARHNGQDAEDHRGRIALVLGQAVFGLGFGSSETCADPHLHRRRGGAETGAELPYPRALVVEA